jgi:hypothetical protein
LARAPSDFCRQVLRIVADLTTADVEMKVFRRDVVILKHSLVKASDGVTRVADGFGGEPAVLGLYGRGVDDFGVQDFHRVAFVFVGNAHGDGFDTFRSDLDATVQLLGFGGSRFSDLPVG